MLTAEQAEDYIPINRDMNWVITAEIESRLGADVKEGMAELIKTGFADLTTDLQHNLNTRLVLSENERSYYFDNNVIGYSGDADILTIHSVNSWVRAKLEAWHSGTAESLDAYKTIYNSVSLTNLWNRSYNSQPNLELKGYVRWNSPRYDHDERILRNNPVINHVSKIENHYILKEPFFTPEGSLYNFRYWDSGWRGSASRKSFGWHGANSSLYVYKAKDPRLNIYSPFSRPDGELHVREGEFSALNIHATYGVKLLAANIYREGESQPVASYLQVMDGENLNEADGLREFIIDLSELTTDPHFLQAPEALEEGRYRLVIGVLDKFNKIYLYESENFVYDLTPPQLTKRHGEEPVNPSSNLNQSDSTLIRWAEIKDNYTVHPDYADYIYIDFGSGAIPVKEAEADGHPIFAFEEGAVRVVREGDYGPMNIYLQDLAGNRTVLAEYKSFTYYVSHPEVSLVEPERIYRSGEEVLFKVNDISGQLRLAKLRLLSADGSIDRAILQDIPTRLSAFSFERKLLNKTEPAGAERELLERLYSRDGRAYYLTPALSEADEVSLRRLLADLGYNGYGPINEIVVPLTYLEGKQGEFRIKIEVVDIGGNLNKPDNREFLCYLSDQKDDLSFTVNGKTLPETGRAIFNLSNSLLVERKNSLIERYDIRLFSPDLADSHNSRNIKGYNGDSWSMTISTDSRLQSEELNLEVTAHYKSGKIVTFKRALTVYNDNSVPALTITEQSPGSYHIKITDPAGVDLAAINYLVLQSDNTPLGESSPLPLKTESGWTLNGWEPLSTELRTELTFNITLEPGTMAIIYLADRFGNNNGSNLAPATFQHNHLEAGYDFIIDSKADLIALDPAGNNYTVYGNVLIRCDLSLESYERFNITTLADRPTTVYLDSTNVGHPLVIKAAEGTVTLKSDLNSISFKGIGKSYRLDSGTIGYNWFGFQGSTESLIRVGTERIAFYNAVAPLSYRQPANALVLENILVADSRMAVHWIDAPSAYNTLTIRNAEFTNLVYGVKLERAPFALLPTGWADSYLLLENCLTEGIKRAIVYSGE